MFGNTARVAHLVQHTLEQRRVGQRVLAQAEQADEGLVPEAQRPIRTKARHASRQPIEQVALRRFQPPMLGPRLFQFMLIDRIARYAGRPQRHVHDSHCAPLTIDRGGHHALDRFVAGDRIGGGRLGGQARHRFDQFGAVSDDIGRARRIDRAHIGAVDQAEAQVRCAMPHREGRSLDQSRQSLQCVAQLLDMAAQRLDFGLAVGRVENPQDDATARRDARPGGRTAYKQQARRAMAAHR